MNIECVIDENNSEVALKRFVGRVFDRLVRATRIYLGVMIGLCLILEGLRLSQGRNVEFFFPAILLVCWLVLYCRRRQYVKAFVSAAQRMMSGTTTVTLTDTVYEFRSGENIVRTAWKDLGTHYLFMGEGVVVLLEWGPRLFLPSLPALGVDPADLRTVFDQAGLEDRRMRKNWGALAILLGAIAFGVVGSLLNSKFSESDPDEAYCCSEDDDEEQRPYPNDSETKIVALSSETERFAKAIADADRVVIRKGGFGCCSDPDKAPVLITLTNAQEIAEFGRLFKFQDAGETDQCMCCGFPGIDWWKGDKMIARTAIQHLSGLRWKGFCGDAQFTPEAKEALADWFAARKIEIP